MLISLIVPTLNENDTIFILLQKIDFVAKNLAVNGNSLELIIVDDRSTDGTQEKIKNAKPNFSYPIILHERQIKDLATAVLDGFKLASGGILGVMDADLSHPPEIIPSLIAALGEADVAVGSRNIFGGGVENWPYHRKLASVLGASLARAVGVKIRDPMSGFFFLRRHVLEGVALSPIGYKILLEILVKGRPKKVVEIPYIFLNRTVGKSKLGGKVIFNYLRHLWRLLLWRIRFK